MHVRVYIYIHYQLAISVRITGTVFLYPGYSICIAIYAVLNLILHGSGAWYVSRNTRLLSSTGECV